MTAETLGYDVFDCGPPMRLESRLRLRSPGKPSLALRLAVLVVVSWVPLLLFAIVQSYSGLGPGVISFVSDCGVNVRTFVVVPALIFAEIDCLPWLRHVVGQFGDTGLVVGTNVRLVDLIGPVLGALLPFVPIVLLVLPIQTLLSDLAELLL